MNDSRTLARQSGFGFAGVLILLGVFGLLWNFHVLPDGFWGEFWTLWPLLLVAVGVNLVLSRQRAWLGSVAALAVVTGSLVAAWGLAVANPPSRAVLTISPESIAVMSDGAESARLNLTLAAGDLALTGGAPAGLLLTGGSRGSVADVTDQRERPDVGRPTDGGRAAQHGVELRLSAAPLGFIGRTLDSASRRGHSNRCPSRDRSIGPRSRPAGAECAEPER